MNKNNINLKDVNVCKIFLLCSFFIKLPLLLHIPNTHRIFFVVFTIKYSLEYNNKNCENSPFSQKDAQKFEWQNGHPFSIANWGTDEPFSATPESSTCFASTLHDDWNMRGGWKRLPCQEKMPYICQIAPGKY